MPVSPLVRRLGAALLLFLAWSGVPGRGLADESVRLEACAALTAEPGLDAVWPAAAGLRPGGLALPGDKGLGCRFLLAGEPGGEAVAVEARLRRPASQGRDEAADRWFVPVRRGEPAVAAYAFAGPGGPAAGTWTLELVRDGKVLAQTRFEVSPAVSPAADGPSAVSLPVRPPSGPGDGQPAAGPPSPSAAAAPLPRPAGPPAAAKRLPPVAAVSPRAAYALQTGIFADPGNAQAQAARLRSRGIWACVAVEGAGTGHRYRVLAGRFADRQAALAGRDKVAGIAGISPLPFPLAGPGLPSPPCR